MLPPAVSRTFDPVIVNDLAWLVVPLLLNEIESTDTWPMLLFELPLDAVPVNTIEYVPDVLMLVLGLQFAFRLHAWVVDVHVIGAAEPVLAAAVPKAVIAIAKKTRRRKFDDMVVVLMVLLQETRLLDCQPDTPLGLTENNLRR